MALAPGTKLGPYEIGVPLGAGGMGEVYRAKDTRLERSSRGIVMRPPFRSKQEVIINAPLEAVWSFSMDLTKIPEFHPRVFKVDLLAGKALREPG
jgi:serine/threonine protein kinase